MPRRPAPDRQLLLGLPTQTAMGRDDFLQAAPNALALATIEDPAGLPAGKLIVTGPPGAGKTHLAHIWAERTGARILAPTALEADLAAVLTAGPGAVAIDDADRLAGGPGEEALFHLHNHLQSAGGALLLTARAPVRDWGLALPDLVSRLSATAHVALAAPDDALLAAVLVKLFNDRQIRIQPTVIDYMIARMERSLAQARSLVALLDQRALQLRRPVTRALVHEVLSEFTGVPLDNDTG
ncbi:MAG: ATPase involved in DNA replication initiation [Rhodobacteraceae bacterium HLUCCA12]|nr:MAG: ATPase involved in DNA replication initiation [Rhodobacteraceae bacterium HLUCCA12]